MLLNTIYAENKSYCFCWIPSHVGIAEHDTVDVMAKTAAHLIGDGMILGGV